MEEEIKVNKNCVNAKIQAHILSEPEMRPPPGSLIMSKISGISAGCYVFRKINFTGILRYPFL